MPRDSGGAYTLPAGNPVAADTLIDATWANSTLSDLGNEMSNTLHKDGRVSMTGPLVLSTRGTPLDTDAASWENILTRIRENFVSITGRAWRRQTKSAGYTAVLADNMSWLNFTANATLSLPAAATAGNGYMLIARAGAGVTLTIDPDGSEVVNNLATISVVNLGAAILLCDGTTWVALVVQNIAATTLTDPVLTKPSMSSVRETFSSNSSASGSVSVDCSGASTFDFQLTGNITTLTFTNVPTSVAYSATFRLTQDATGGRTITWPASVKWPSATAPTLSTGAAKTDIITLLTFDGGTAWYGFVAGQNF